MHKEFVSDVGLLALVVAMVGVVVVVIFALHFWVSGDLGFALGSRGFPQLGSSGWTA